MPTWLCVSPRSHFSQASFYMLQVLCLLSADFQTCQPGSSLTPKPHMGTFTCAHAWTACTLILLGVVQGWQRGHHLRACQKCTLRPTGHTTDPLSSNLHSKKMPRQLGHLFKCKKLWCTQCWAQRNPIKGHIIIIYYHSLFSSLTKLCLLLSPLPLKDITNLDPTLEPQMSMTTFWSNSNISIMITESSYSA